MKWIRNLLFVCAKACGCVASGSARRLAMHSPRHPGRIERLFQRGGEGVRDRLADCPGGYISRPEKFCQGEAFQHRKNAGMTLKRTPKPQHHTHPHHGKLQHPH